MADTPDRIIELARIIERAKTGDAGARASLTEDGCEQFRHLVRAKLRGFPAVRRWEETGDVLQNLWLRLHGALKEYCPDSVSAYFVLASTHINRELIDLYRRHHGPRGIGAKHASGAGEHPSVEADPLREEADNAPGPADRAEWAEVEARLHEQVAGLPEHLREMVFLHVYQGLSLADVASQLGIGLEAVKSRWRTARRTLGEALGDPDRSR